MLTSRICDDTVFPSRRKKIRREGGKLLKDFDSVFSNLVQSFNFRRYCYSLWPHWELYFSLLLVDDFNCKANNYCQQPGLTCAPDSSWTVNDDWANIRHKFCIHSAQEHEQRCGMIWNSMIRPCGELQVTNFTFFATPLVDNKKFKACGIPLKVRTILLLGWSGLMNDKLDENGRIFYCFNHYKN